jgi:hypothetical protein
VYNKTEAEKFDGFRFLKSLFMFYKPKFCCECGEKIFRKDWKFWTSRRFCEICEIDKKAYEVLPKITGALLFLLGVFGFGSLILRKDTVQEIKIERIPFAKTVEKTYEQNLGTKNLEQIRNPSDASISKVEKFEKSAKYEKVKSDEPVYYCGAETKKGGFCKRRVKGGGRCWQHQGQEAILPPEKLLVVP